MYKVRFLSYVCWWRCYRCWFLSASTIVVSPLKPNVNQVMRGHHIIPFSCQRRVKVEGQCWECDDTWVCLKMLCKPLLTQWLYNDHYPVSKWLFLLGVYPIFRHTHLRANWKIHRTTEQPRWDHR